MITDGPARCERSRCIGEYCDANSAAPARATRLVFDRYVLDFDRGCLLLHGHEVPLRPKTFAVLSYLVENAGRLVSKDDIFAAVWPNLAVTDDTLVQSIGELRRELGDDGSRLIKTIPRRGYRFDAVVTVPTVERPSPVTAALPQQALPAHSQSNESLRAGARVGLGKNVISRPRPEGIRRSDCRCSADRCAVDFSLRVQRLQFRHSKAAIR
ncbi:MAG TPA: transcriptional regulator [Xanthobacteraceae bacterium]|jgi:DNA-binding winged helix-turn-helix (wHTH) protein